ncbi:MAG TPA: hypothetical protein VKF84_18145 [Candidatus Sulfotelmatobacter sp.]|nr:hypothetical protein [Candidatus Sulfotelmatobacter sp.]
MPRSYFRQFLPRADRATLTPPRPVANLWKSARLDWIAAEAPHESTAPVPYVSRRPPAPAGSLTRPPAPPAIESKLEPLAPATLRPRQTLQPSEPSPPASRNESLRGKNVSQPVTAPGDIRAEFTEEVRAPIATTPEIPPTTRKSVPQGSDLSTPPDIPRLSQLASSAQQNASEISERRPAKLETRLEASRVSSVRPESEAEPPARPTATRAAMPVAAAPAPVSPVPAQMSVRSTPQVSALAPLAPPPVPATRSRIDAVRQREENVASNRPAREESRASTQNAVQIGKIEVQVVSPPAAARYVAQPASPKGRLARGYALWSPWQ